MTRLWVLVALGLVLGLLPPAWADRTRLQDAMERKGVLLRRLSAAAANVSCGEAGRFPNGRRQVYVEGVAVYEPLAEEPQKGFVRGVRLSILQQGVPRPANQFPEYNSGWLDLDECAGVLQALRHVHAVVAKDGVPYPQFRLVTRGGVIVSTYDSPLPAGQSFRAVSLNYPFSMSGESVNMNPAELEQVISALEKAAAAAQALTLEK